MPDVGFLFLSFVSVILGVLLILFPRVMVKLSELFNRTFITMDERLMRYRFLIGLLALVASYAFLKIAFMLPSLRG